MISLWDVIITKEKTQGQFRLLTENILNCKYLLAKSLILKILKIY